MKLENSDQIQELAESYLECFSPCEVRENGVLINTYIINKGDAEKAQALINSLHEDGQNKSRWIYRYAVNTLSAITDNPPERWEALIDELDADPYYDDVINWLKSDQSNFNEVNDSVQELGVDTANFNIMTVISGGQIYQKQKVFRGVLTYFNKLVNGEDADFDD